MTGAPVTRAVPRVRAALMAVISLAAAGGLYLGALAGAGFPDGHLSEYHRWISPYQRLAVAALLALATGFAGLALVATSPPVAARWFRGGVLVMITLLLAALVVLPALGLHLWHLEHGQGG